MMIINPFRFGAPPPSLEDITLRIASGTVSANLTDFVTRVDLATMPAAFWSSVHSTGKDIRVYLSDGTTQVPFDLVHIDTVNEIGELFFKASLLNASNNDFIIKCGDHSLSLLPVTDTFGRYATWTDYERVFIFPEHRNRTSATGHATLSAGDTVAPFLYGIESTSPTVAGRQGVAWDGTYYYVTDTNGLYKYDASWSLISSETDVCGATGISGVDHVGDLAHKDGLLYLPVEKYPNTPYNNQHIAVFDASDLSFVTSYDISAQGHEVSTYAFNPDDGYLYAADYVTGGTLYKYNPAASFAYVGALTLSRSRNTTQGLTFIGGKIILSIATSTKGLFQYSLDGKEEALIAVDSTTANVPQGLEVKDGKILWLVQNFSATDRFVYTVAQNTRTGKVGWFNVNVGAYLKDNTVPRSTTWTMGATVQLTTIDTTNRVALSYAVDGATDSNRGTLAHRGTVSPPRFAVWNSTNSWLNASVSPDAVDTTYRVAMRHNGTTERAVVRNGTVTTAASPSARPGSTGDTTLFIGAEDTTNGEGFRGGIQHVYIRHDALADAWLAAEDVSWRTPSSFYTIL